MIAVLALGLAGIILLTAAASGWQSIRIIANGSFTFFWDFFLFCVPFISSTAAFMAIIWLWVRVKGELVGFYRDLNVSDQGMPGTRWPDLGRLKVLDVADMVRLRVTSLMAMAASVFMKRIRSLVYDEVYGDETYNNKRGRL